MSTSSQERELKNGDILFREGDKGDHAYLVQDGEVEIVKNIDTPSETVIDTVGKGELVGEMAVLEERPRVASARIKGQAKIVTLDRISFLSRATKDPHVALRVMRTLSDRLRSSKSAIHESDSTKVPEALTKLQELSFNENIFQRKVMISSIVLILITFTMFIGTVLVEVETTVSAPAKVIPSTPNLVLEAETEGFLKEVLINPGDQIEKGQVIAKLDISSIEAQIKSTSSELASAQDKLKRLKDERIIIKEEKDINSLSQTSDSVLLARTTLRHSKILGFDQDINSSEAKLRHKQSESEVIKIEYDIAKEQTDMMSKSKSISKMDRLSSKRTLAQTERMMLEKEAEIIILEGELEKIKAEKRSFITEWNADIEKNIEEQEAIIPMLSAQLETLNVEKEAHTIRSPISGKVLELHARREGTILQKGHPIAELTRSGQDLVVEAEVKPKDIEALKEGLPVSFKLDALPFQRYGDMSGVIIRVDDDAVPSHRPNIEDEFYMIHIKLDKSSPKAAPQDFYLRRGMTGKADMITGKRTIASYLLDPFLGSISTAFREAS